MKAIIRYLLLLTCAWLLLPMPAQALDTKDSVTIGFDETFVPFGFKDDSGEYVGFDIDLAKEILGRMDVDYEFQPIDWTLKETELNTGNIDMIWNGYTKTKEREKKLAFSDVYHQSRQIFVVMEDNEEIQTREDLAGKVVATQDDSSPLENMRQDPGFMKSLDGGAPVTYPSYVEVFTDLETGRADAIAVEDSMLLYYLAAGLKGDNYRILDESQDLGIGEIAVGFRKEDEDFVKEFNKVLKDVKDDGTFDQIKEKWLVQPEE